eukprot:scaffold14334_cov28-Tisochrysis_lutea.AAC.5
MILGKGKKEEEGFRTGHGHGGGVLWFSGLCWFNLSAAGPKPPSSATEPRPRDGGVRAWRMARPVDVAREARQEDSLRDYNSFRTVGASPW